MSIFDTLELEAFRNGINPRTKQSRAWFSKKAIAMTSINRRKLMREEPITTMANFKPGHMFMYFYDPKHKKTLPYYDRFPLSIIVDAAPNGFYGLNLHYLPMTLRAKFLDSLIDIASSRSYDERTRFKLTYQLLQGASKYRYFKPCFKHYLMAHVQSNFAHVAAPEWEIAAFLPTAQFKKASETKVHKDSRDML